MPERIAIQGFEGSFHEEAALRFFGPGTEVLPCSSFREVVRLACDPGASEGGVMAIENSIAGSILPNYALLHGSGLVVRGEVYLHIRQHLLVNEGVTLEDIREVQSHPMALLQCLEFLGRYPWKLVETEDTALSAQHIHRHRSRHAAAIAGQRAADRYGLRILQPDIQSERQNYTRFLVLGREPVAIEGSGKASLSFRTPHERGALARVLGAVAEAELNLSKLQSMPVAETPWQYSFHADMEFHSADSFRRALQIIEPLTEGLKVYGMYPKGSTT